MTEKKEEEDVEFGAVGAVKAAGELAETSVGKALLLPSAQALGGYMGEGVQAWIDARKRRRVENIKTHIDVVKQITGDEPAQSAQDTDAFLEWFEGAGSIDPTDADLATIWQAALLALSENSLMRRRVLAIAKQLQPDDAAAFAYYTKLVVIDGRISVEQARDAVLPSRVTLLLPDTARRRLTELGLLERIQDVALRFLPMAFALIVIILLVPYLVTLAPLTARLEWPFPVSDTFGVTLALGLVLGITIAYPFVRRPRLTEEGKYLRQLFARVKAAPPSNPPETTEKTVNVDGGDDTPNPANPGDSA